MRNRLLNIFAAASLLFASLCAAQTTTLTGTLIDSDSTAWANATWSGKIFNPTGGPLVYTTNGQPVPSNPSGTLNASGVFTGTLPDNSKIVAQGTQWTLTVCSHTSAPCVTIPPVAVTGASYNMGTYASANVTAPRVPAGSNAYAYSSVEVVDYNDGSTYYNVTDGTYYVYDGTKWVALNGATSSGVQYNPANTNYIWYSDSLFIVSNTNTVTATAVNCDGTNCVVTAPNSYVAGQPVQFAGTWSPSCLNYVIASVESTGLSSAQFEVPETNVLGIGSIGSVGCSGSQTGTGGSVQDASYFAPFAASKLPFFDGHGTNYDYGLSGGTSTDMVNDYASMVHPHTTAVTGNPSFVIIKVSVNDWTGGIGGNCFTTATAEANYQTLMEDAHNDGSKVIVMTANAWPYNGIGCDGGVGFSRATQVNDWLRGQGFSSSVSGQPARAYWDRLIDVGSVFTNYSDTNFRLASYHLNDGGNAYLAALTNAGMGVQGSSIQALVSSTCGVNTDIACLNEGNTFQSSQSITAHTPNMNLTNNDTGGGSSNWTVWGSNGMNFWQFNGQNTMAWWPITNGFSLTLQANHCYGWDDATGGAFLLTDAPDAAICRDGPDGFDFGNGTWKDKSGTINAKNLNLSGICSGCTGNWLKSTTNCTASGSSYATCTNAGYVNWPTAFPDLNYKVVCFGNGPSNGSGPSGSVSGDIFSYTKSTTGLLITIQTNTSSGFSYSEIDCVGSE